MAKIICGIRFEVKGREHIPKEGAIFAVKHQSAWETLALWCILDRPIFVLKRELHKIPVFGPYLKKVDNIAIDRGGGSKTIRQMITQAKHYLQKKRAIIIFPEGTRIPPGETRSYRIGIAALYDALSPPVIPVALNSGCFWGRNAFQKKPGTITVEFLPPMQQGLDKKNFLNELHARIETASTALLPDEYRQKSQEE
jgi:1-acyl-sn-glycerol-3-phosphate acyltransferase